MLVIQSRIYVACNHVETAQIMLNVWTLFGEKEEEV